MPTVAASVADLLNQLSGIVHVENDKVVVDDAARLRSQGAADLAWTAAFTADEAAGEAARWIIWEAAQAVGVYSASIQELYMARSRGEVKGFTVPAMNLRAQTFDMARTIYETAARNDVGALLLEIARSEQTYTFQRPMDFAASVYAGAMAAGWSGPVFVQGDHYQFNAKKYATDPEAMTEEIRRACKLAIEAGYRNIDIDSSTLVDLSQPNLDLEQKVNYTKAAELTALIRSLEDDGVAVSVGGEIGEVGKTNSTVDDLKAYLDGYDAVLARLAPGAKGLSKVSVQTGTSHGGVPLPGGGVAEVKLDFGTLAKLGEYARERGLAGAVQHGASTLPDELFHKFPEVETAEIHLATGFQNALYGHPAFPAEMMAEINAWLVVNAADERKADQTEDQFLYTTRKKAIGPFKRQLWDLATKDEILASQGAKVEYLFRELKVIGSREMVNRYVQPVPVSRPIPAAVKAALA
ncbi:MAG: class II fructose-bisphosphate aldolase [Chloroflexota bacterium]